VENDDNDYQKNQKKNENKDPEHFSSLDNVPQKTNNPY